MFYNYEIANKLLYGSRNRDAIIAADNIMKKNEFLLPPIGRVVIDVENNFKSNQTSRSFWRVVHGLTFLGDLFTAHNKTKEKKYIEKAQYLIDLWFIYRANNPDDKMIYHDETTALRLSYLMKFYYHSYNVLEEKFKNKLYIEIKDTVSLLCTDKFHSTNTNHGMFQDLSLLAYSILFNNEPKKTKVYKKAIQRLLDYFLTCFTADGVHKEHAPDYHYLVANYVRMVSNIIKELDGNLTTQETKLIKIYENSEKYSKFIILPDGSLPNISDCPRIMLSQKPTYYSLYNSEEFNFVKTKGKEGMEPLDRQKAFLDAGSFISRSGWTEKDSYFLFLANYNGAYHKHTDDLSFILYYKNDIFIDSGPNGYDYDNKFTRYAYSGYSHSTLIVNGATLPRTDGKMDKVGLEYARYENDGSTFEVKGYNKRYDDVIHNRKITGDNQNKKYTIQDEIYSSKRNHYKILFQISYLLNISINGNFVSIYKNDTKIAEIEIHNESNNSNFKIRHIKGQLSPQVQGFEFPKMGSNIASNTIEVSYNNETDESKLISIIRLENFKLQYNNYTKELSYGLQNIKYNLVENGNNKRRLLIVFTSNISNKSQLENYYDSFKEVDSLQLFINNCLDVSDNLEYEQTDLLKLETEKLALIQNLIRKYQIDIKNVTLIGLENDGRAALYYGMKYGFYNIIVAEPPILIDNKIQLNEFGSSEETGISKCRFLTADFEGIEMFSGYYKNFHICVGSQSSNLVNHLHPFEKLLRTKKIGMNILKIPIPEGVDSRLYFKDFLNESLNNIYGLNIKSENNLLQPIYKLEYKDLYHSISNNILNINLELEGTEFVVIYQFLDKFNNILFKSKMHYSDTLSIKESDFMNKRIKITIRGRYESFKLISNIIRDKNMIQFKLI